ncbi:MAG: hypothetical protein ABIA62_00140 [Candidatus Woesearchaeota archaeon]
MANMAIGIPIVIAVGIGAGLNVKIAVQRQIYGMPTEKKDRDNQVFQALLGMILLGSGALTLGLLVFLHI